MSEIVTVGKYMKMFTGHDNIKLEKLKKLILRLNHITAVIM